MGLQYYCVWVGLYWYCIGIVLVLDRPLYWTAFRKWAYVLKINLYAKFCVQVSFYFCFEFTWR